MKARSVLVALVALHAVSCIAAEPGPACATKIVNIESQLADAKTHGRVQQVAGLNEALRATKANCTDESLAKDHDAGIQKAQRKLTERERELVSAERTGDSKKIAKRRAKVEDARRELAKAETPLVK
ncbi:MAG: DUF1090 domain-containing protein [Burkholderiaceae bacterium]|nr:DUF1090 domain-containing protein [Burkholderiaceae bacterium]